MENKYFCHIIASYVKMFIVSFSLNDITLNGIIEQPDLFDTLCRFRIYKYVIIYNIEKMFRKILINSNQTYCIVKYFMEE